MCIVFIYQKIRLKYLLPVFCTAAAHRYLQRVFLTPPTIPSIFCPSPPLPTHRNIHLRFSQNFKKMDLSTFTTQPKI